MKLGMAARITTTANHGLNLTSSATKETSVIVC